MNRILTTIVALGLLAPTAVTSQPHASAQQWKLSWSDEFNGPDGAPPDPAKWEVVTGGSGFGNKELEQYTARPENVHQEHGNLVITARQESFTGPDGIHHEYTSARLNTMGKFEQKYGRFEARIKIPQGQGIWPAFWLLGSDDTSTGWPGRGEIDIMESRGNNHTYSLGGNDMVSSALHWGPDPTNDAYLHTTNHKNALHSEYGDAFHTYGLEWTEKYLFTYVDTRLLQVMYNTFSKPFWPQGGFPFATENGTRLVDPWSQTGRPQTPFDQDFYLIINVAVGGQNGWFLDGHDGKPWIDASPTARNDFWNARDRWYPTWEQNGQMIVDRVQMWQKC